MNKFIQFNSKTFKLCAALVRCTLYEYNFWIVSSELVLTNGKIADQYVPYVIFLCAR